MEGRGDFSVALLLPNPYKIKLHSDTLQIYFQITVLNSAWAIPRGSVQRFVLSEHYQQGILQDMICD